MKNVISILIFVCLFPVILSAGVLHGRIIKEDGKSLANTKVTFEGKTITTNSFGGYSVELKDGQRKLVVIINGERYESEEIRIYSPKTKQNWRKDRKTKKLIKIR